MNFSRLTPYPENLFNECGSTGAQISSDEDFDNLANPPLIEIKKITRYWILNPPDKISHEANINALTTTILPLRVYLLEIENNEYCLLHGYGTLLHKIKGDTLEVDADIIIRKKNTPHHRICLLVGKLKKADYAAAKQLERIYPVYCELETINYHMKVLGKTDVRQTKKTYCKGLVEFVKQCIVGNCKSNKNHDNSSPRMPQKILQVFQYIYFENEMNQNILKSIMDNEVKMGQRLISWNVLDYLCSKLKKVGNELQKKILGQILTKILDKKKKLSNSEIDDIISQNIAANNEDESEVQDQEQRDKHNGTLNGNNNNSHSYLCKRTVRSSEHKSTNASDNEVSSLESNDDSDSEVWLKNKPRSSSISDEDRINQPDVNNKQREDRTHTNDTVPSTINNQGDQDGNDNEEPFDELSIELPQLSDNQFTIGIYYRGRYGMIETILCTPTNAPQSISEVFGGSESYYDIDLGKCKSDEIIKLLSEGKSEVFLGIDIDIEGGVFSENMKEKECGDELYESNEKRNPSKKESKECPSRSSHKRRLEDDLPSARKRQKNAISPQEVPSNGASFMKDISKKENWF